MGGKTSFNSEQTKAVVEILKNIDSFKRRVPGTDVSKEFGNTRSKSQLVGQYGNLTRKVSITNRKDFSQEENLKLAQLYSKYNGKWNDIEKEFNSGIDKEDQRTSEQLRNHHNCLFFAKTKKGAWSKEEKERLWAIVAKHTFNGITHMPAVSIVNRLSISSEQKFFIKEQYAKGMEPDEIHSLIQNKFKTDLELIKVVNICSRVYWNIDSDEDDYGDSQENDSDEDNLSDESGEDLNLGFIGNDQNFNSNHGGQHSDNNNNGNNHYNDNIESYDNEHHPHSHFSTTTTTTTNNLNNTSETPRRDNQIRQLKDI
ncbi:hypothetical protein PPL_03666 [Heterostelium album PN500]|uniref:Myb-like domain-containing protein n=1 Tax=Heterostelium pallidum (strain ATCC 26659 / Pp 5 / PN500) TaxID=670386 RepID=D3B6B8_HETP5|nr:hypothetical protein PPL_03666 [Heterostelium album PN500]EFA82888.1 hypothetical protein PPL_03666 [Heterostelium album PN500]|eukprot:XP_020435005.1 hypothetical protein PPL_03666 [Heterostelium album PN500]